MNMIGELQVLGKYKGHNVYAVNNWDDYWSIVESRRKSGDYFAVWEIDGDVYKFCVNDYAVGKISKTGQLIMGEWQALKSPKQIITERETVDTFVRDGDKKIGGLVNEGKNKLESILGESKKLIEKIMGKI